MSEKRKCLNKREMDDLDRFYSIIMDSRNGRLKGELYNQKKNWTKRLSIKKLIGKQSIDKNSYST